MKDPKLERKTKWGKSRRRRRESVSSLQNVLVCVEPVNGSGRIRSSGTNLHLTWAGIHLNMVTNIQSTQGALDLSNQTL